ncbi:MAG: hypothetical protein HeimAB125_21360 [Candidatus Heimdallarchaeota archaeon AB_125]|nr:MAG: hypothetical protein HeimAB125_21360 [Candidatus Heimdallarchaeota archaeon AB_125]
MWYNQPPYMEESVMYSPVFAQNTTLADKVHYIANIHRDTNEPGVPYTFKTMDITYKITLHHYFSSNSSTKVITYTEFLLEPIPGPQTEYWFNFEENSTLTTYTIPTGDRLKVTYELKYEDITATQGHITTNIMPDGLQSGYGIGATTNVVWDIVDGVHSNTYTFSNTDGILGVQLYMREEIYPDVNFYGPSNNTIHTTNETVNIAVTEGSTSYYRWDGGTWNSFDNTTSTELTSTLGHGWHYLEVSASDPLYNNTRIEVLRLGYDATYDNLVLHNAESGETYAGGYEFDFSAYNTLSVSYSWDEDPTPDALSDPFDITAPSFNGLHYLEVNTTDLFKTRTYNYEFYFDSDAPTISLDNVANDSFLLGGKTIKVEIIDYSSFTWLNFSWDAGSIQSWTYDVSNIYSTVMPSGLGSHDLYIYAEDVYGHNYYLTYVFTTDPTVFSVDLRYMDDSGYYLGGNDVELIIQQSNSTVYYTWNGGTEKNTTLVTESLILTGADSLPNVEGTHVLNITTFDSFDVRNVITFTFFVDKTAPQFVGDYLSYNNTRQLGTTLFSFDVDDNNISRDALNVLYSLDEKIYKLFATKFNFSLYGLADSPHTLDVKVYDLSGNVNITRIYFTIDNTAPNIILVNIPSLVDDSEHGDKYVPANALVQVFSSDNDPGYNTSYSWDGQAFQLFIDSFNLNSTTDKEAELIIRAMDTLGNYVDVTYNLVYDSTPPDVFLLDPSPLDQINDRTALSFNVTDFSEYSISNVEYEWDILALPNSVSWDLDGDFEILMAAQFVTLYDGAEFANLSITVADLLGNEETYTFDFTFDIYAPILDFYIKDIVNITMTPFGEYPVVGGTEIRYNISAENDIKYIQVWWDDETEFEPIVGPYWNFTVPKTDGNHTLRVILYDNTGKIDYESNKVESNFILIVDDITVSYVFPVDFESGEHVTLLYNDTYTYIVNVTDAIDEEIIEQLEVAIFYDISYNLSIGVSNISTIYTVTLQAWDVTNFLETEIHVQFYQGSLAQGQTVSLFLTVNKKEGNLTILEETDTSVEYYEDFEIVLNLQNDLGDNLTIEKLYLNNSEEFDIISTESECRFYYSSTTIGQKGNFSLVIRAESLFYNSTPSINTTILLEIRPIPVLLNLWVSNTTILEGQSVTINANLTLIDSTPIPFETITFFIYIYYKNDTTIPSLVKFDFFDYNDSKSIPDTTNLDGLASISFLLEENIAYIGVKASYLGTPIFDIIEKEFDEIIVTYPPPEGFPRWLLYVLIGGSIGVAAIVSYVVYKLTRPKSFEELMEKVAIEDIALNYSIMSPGVILTIFDQRKGPIPLIGDHSLDIGRYIGRMRIGVENFLLKIADQAYSSLGFEEHDAGRRVGSIILPTEKMTGFVHGLQLENKMARGGFENLSLIVLADTEYGSLLLNYQEHLYEEIDEMISKLKSKKPLKEIEEFIKVIRRKSVIIMLAAKEMEAQQGTE